MDLSWKTKLALALLAAFLLIMGLSVLLGDTLMENVSAAWGQVLLGGGYLAGLLVIRLKKRREKREERKTPEKGPVPARQVRRIRWIDAVLLLALVALLILLALNLTGALDLSVLFG